MANPDFESLEIVLNYHRVLTILPFLLLSLTGCNSPSSTLKAMEEAAAKGDHEAFGQYFTKESTPFAQSLLALYKSKSEASARRDYTPLKLLSRANVVDESIYGDTAHLLVEMQSTGAKSLLVFRRENARWKMDLLSTELINRGEVEDAP